MLRFGALDHLDLVSSRKSTHSGWDGTSGKAEDQPEPVKDHTEFPASLQTFTWGVGVNSSEELSVICNPPGDDVVESENSSEDGNEGGELTVTLLSVDNKVDNDGTDISDNGDQQTPGIEGGINSSTISLVRSSLPDEDPVQQTDEGGN